jgi:Golgi nucleoside diphosphatase
MCGTVSNRIEKKSFEKLSKNCQFFFKKLSKTCHKVFKVFNKLSKKKVVKNLSKILKKKILATSVKKLS